MLIHSPVDGRLGCFQLLGSTNKASVSIVHQYFCGTKFPFLLDKYLGVEKLDHI